MSSVNTYSSALKERMDSMASSLQDVFDGGEKMKLDIVHAISHTIFLVSCENISR